MNLNDISRKLSKILRHDPTPLKMSNDGWIKVDDILQHFKITLDDIKFIVNTNDKQRFKLNDDNTLICANQGHSKNVAINKSLLKITKVDSDLILYHGTDLNAYNLIKKSSFNTGNRQHVHWTNNIELAKKRSSQKANINKSKGIIITLNARHYINEKGLLYKSENDVYLTPEIFLTNLLNIIDI